jgi:hypothetical protein
MIRAYLDHLDCINCFCPHYCPNFLSQHTVAIFDLMGNDAEIQFRNVEHFTDWRPLGVQRCLAASSRNFVGLMEDGLTVLK